MIGPVAAFLFPLFLTGAPAAPAQDDPSPDKVHVRVYKKVAPATVYVSGGGEEGSGVVIDPSGIILTSPTACGTSSRTVTVLTAGAKAWQGRVLGRVNDKELVVVKIDAEKLPFLELGDSDAVKLGQVSYVFGDSYHSMKSDDQPALSLGVVSGLYEVKKKLGGSQYTGKVIETSAAVNPNQDGGPLVDREGRLLGLVTLNYEESKFTGIAVPVNALKKDIERILKGPAEAPAAKEAREPAWLGLEVKAVTGGLEVTRVTKKGPADQAGVRKGDLLTRAGDAKTLTRAALDKALEARAPGESLTLTVLREGVSEQLTAKLGSRPLY